MQTNPNGTHASKRRYLITALLIGVFACIAVVAGNAEAQNQTDTQNGAETLDPQIINGSNALIGNYPFMVQLETADGEHVCGGTLYSTRTVLTATHCLINPRTGKEYNGVQNYVIRYGSTTQHGGDVVGFTNYYPSGTDNSHRKNDVTVVALDAPIPLSDRVALVSLATDAEMANLDVVTAVGWGKDTNSGGPAERLQQANIQLDSDEECLAAYGDNRFFPDRQFCGGGVTTDICHGDSGGPILIAVNNQWKQVGMNAEIYELECLSGNPSKFSDISYFREFIRNVNPEFPTPTPTPGPVTPRKCKGQPATVDLALGQRPTEGDDRIVGTDGNDRIDGLGGNDIICGLGGDDVIIGGDGNDKIYGGSGDDNLWGGAGNDVIMGQSGSDSIGGGSGQDILAGHADDDFISGGADADVIKGFRGNDTLAGGDGDDKISGYRGNDVLRGDAGNDDLRGGRGDDKLSGGAGDGDVCRGSAGADKAASSCETIFAAQPLTLSESLDLIDETGDVIDPIE